MSGHVYVKRATRQVRSRLGPQQLTIAGSLELIQEIANAFAEVAGGAYEDTEVLTSILRLGQDPTADRPANQASSRVAVEELFQQLNQLNRAAAHLQRTRLKDAAAKELQTTSSNAAVLLYKDELMDVWKQPWAQGSFTRRPRHLTIRGGNFFERMKRGPAKAALRYHDPSLELLVMSLQQATSAYSVIITKSVRLPRRCKEHMRSVAQRGFWRVTCGIGAVITAKLAGEWSDTTSLTALRALSTGENQLRYARKAAVGKEKRGRAATSLQSG